MPNALKKLSDVLEFRSLNFHVTNEAPRDIRLDKKKLVQPNFFIITFLFTISELQALFFNAPAILDLPRGLFKCLMFRKTFGCPHDDIKFILYTP